MRARTPDRRHQMPYQTAQAKLAAIQTSDAPTAAPHSSRTRGTSTLRAARRQLNRRLSVTIHTPPIRRTRELARPGLLRQAPKTTGASARTLRLPYAPRVSRLLYSFAKLCISSHLRSLSWHPQIGVAESDRSPSVYSSQSDERDSICDLPARCPRACGCVPGDQQRSTRCRS